jgi:hypothetical protein
MEKKIFGKLEGNRLLEGFTCRWEDKSNISIKGKGLEVVSWIYLAQDRGMVLS